MQVLASVDRQCAVALSVIQISYWEWHEIRSGPDVRSGLGYLWERSGSRVGVEHGVLRGAWPFRVPPQLVCILRRYIVKAEAAYLMFYVGVSL